MKLFAKNSYKTRGGHRAEITDKSEKRTPYPFKGIVYYVMGASPTTKCGLAAADIWATK